MSKDMWNQRYNSAEYIYGREPNVFFRSEIDKLQPGKLLLPAEGEGRNAVYAARQGWDVLALDQSEAAHRKAIGLAGEAGVTFTYRVTDLLHTDLPPRSFDCIALIFVHFPSASRAAFHTRVAEWLKPGGTLILEAFSKDQLQYSSGGPKDADMLFSITDLAADFSSLRIIRNEELITFHDEGEFHRGDSSVVRLVAIK